MPLQGPPDFASDFAENAHSIPAPAPPILPTLADLAVLIPAWQPSAILPQLVAALTHRGFGVIAVIDDGSRTTLQPFFTQAAAIPRVELLRHPVNRGKGRALKTGFAHLLEVHPQLRGVLTADADGQHTPGDIERVGRALLARPWEPVLGSRRFAADVAGVPWRSRWGNTFARQSFRLFTGFRFGDTQTGLRGLPFALLPSLLAVPGERYEYEMAMLAELCRTGHAPSETLISTVYLENNRGSHFHFFRDSVRVYLMLLGLAGAKWRRR